MNLQTQKDDLAGLLTRLPPVSTESGSGVYGCRSLLAAYCGFRQAPWQGHLAPSGGNWQHGWHPPNHNFHPEVVVGTDGNSNPYKRKVTIYVARVDQENYLRASGYRFVQAIGMPIVYVPVKQISRIPNSLLIMPSHSTDDSRHEWDFKEFANNLLPILSKYELVAACIHPACVRKGYWLKEMSELNIPIIEGASISDRNALLRMQFLLSSFSNVVGNGFGSHLVYATYFGATVSLIPPWPKESLKDFEKVGLLAYHFDVAAKLLELTQEEAVRSEFPCFFSHSHPYDPTWAAWQLGENHKKSPAQIKKLMGWDLLSRLKFSILARIGKRSEIIGT